VKISDRVVFGGVSRTRPEEGGYGGQGGEAASDDGVSFVVDLVSGTLQQSHFDVQPHAD
jgi:hypothetical protein